MALQISDPVVLGYTKGNIETWRNIVKWQKGGICEDCGQPAHHLHECIVTRRDAQGLPDERRLRIFSDCNMVLLCLACHRKAHGDRTSKERWWDVMCQRHGEQEMREWYAGFQWRAPERRFMP